MSSENDVRGQSTFKPNRPLFDEWCSVALGLDHANKSRRNAETGKEVLDNPSSFVVYNDTGSFTQGNFVAFNKPPYLMTHGNGATPPYGMTEILQLATGNFALFNCHRLDTDTTGVILYAKNKPAVAEMHRRFTPRRPAVTSKMYVALVEGIFDPKLRGAVLPLAGTNGIQRYVVEPDMPPIDDSEKTKYNSGKPRISATGLHPISVHEDKNGKLWTLIGAKLYTGRTHQVRVVTSYLGHPIYGDPLYHPEANPSERQLLHAYKLDLKTTEDDRLLPEPITITAPLPSDFKEVIFSMKLKEIVDGNFLRQDPSLLS